MKIRLLLLSALLALTCLTVKAAVTVTYSTIAPTTGTDDRYYLPGNVTEANAISAGNDANTYIASDRGSKIQSFTTGSNPGGYVVTSVKVQHCYWTGTWWNIAAGNVLPIRIGTISGTTLSPIYANTTAAFSGSTISGNGATGTGGWLSWDLSGETIPTLAANTTYFFEVNSATGFIELNCTSANGYAGGQAFLGGDNGALDADSSVASETGDYAFVVKLTAIGAPSVTATVTPSSAPRGQSFSVTATVTPGGGSVTNVSVNLSSMSGSSTASLVFSNANVWTNTFMVPSGAAIGAKTLTVSAKDTTPLTGSYDLSFTVLSGTYVWDGGSAIDSKWSSATNWVSDIAPALSGDAITFAGSTRLSPDLDTNYSITSLTFSNDAGSFAISSSAGSSLTNGSGGIINNSANTQTLNVPVVMAAALTVSLNTGGLTLNSNLTGGLNLTTAGAGTLTFASPGTNTLGNLHVSSGQLNVTAGTVNVADNSGNNTRVESNATVTVSGGTLNINNGIGGWFPIGVTAGSTASVVVSGGTINVVNNYGTEVGNESGSGVLTINSGTFLNNDANDVGLLIADASSPSGTINLNGGALIVNKLGAGAGTGGNVYLNGGTLKPLSSRTDFWNNSANITAQVLANGAIIDSAGFNINIGQTLGDGGGGGGLTKLGNGTLTLTGNLSYSGTTRVLGGALNLNAANTLPSGGDLVVSNAALVLDASGNWFQPANVTINSGSTVTTTNNSSSGAFAINASGNLVVDTNTTFNINYVGLSGIPGAGPIEVAGTMTVTGTNNVINITGSGFTTTGEIPLFQYGSGSLVSISGFKLGALPVGVSAVLTNDTANKWVALNIISIGQNLTWYGNDNSWDINTTANWNSGTAKYLEYGTSPNIYGDLVTFDDSLNGGVLATNVSLATTLRPSQITMNNNSYSYVFSGPGSLAGPTILIVNGPGSLTLQTSNNYTGGTFVNGGTLIVTNDNALGTNTAGVTLVGGKLQFAGSTAGTRSMTLNLNSTLEVLTNVTAQLAGPITGVGGLTKTGNGTLSLSGNNTPAGGLKVGAGAVNITAGSTLLGSSLLSVGNVASGTGRLNLTGNSLVTNDVNSFGGSAFVGAAASSVGVISVAAGSMLKVSDPGLAGGDIGGGDYSVGALYNAGTVTNFGANGAGAGFFVGNDATSPYGYIQNSGTLFVNGRLSLGTTAGGCGVMDVTGGSVTVAGLNQAASMTLGINNGNTGAGSVAALNILNGGTLSYTKTDEVLVNAGTSQYASINVSGAGSDLKLGTVGIRLGNNDTATDTSTLSVHNGGVLEAAWINQFQAASATGILNFNGGTVKATAVDPNGLVQGNQIKAIYVYAGGGIIDNNGLGTITAPVMIVGPLLAPLADGTTTFSVTSITLGGTTSGYVGAPVVQFSGGGGQGAAAYANFDPTTGTITGITVTSPGSGYTFAPTVTLLGGSGTPGTGAGAGAATATANMGAASGGGMTFQGSGLTLLSGTNTYTGNTTINGGTLALGQAVPTLATNSTVSIANGAALQLVNGAVTNVVASLVTNGVVAGNGLYSSANSSGFITGAGYLQVGAVTSGPPYLTNSISGGGTTLSLSWAGGSELQRQTNSLGKGLGTNWETYVTSGSGISSTNISIDKTNGAVFFRLKQ